MPWKGLLVGLGVLLTGLTLGQGLSSPKRLADSSFCKREGCRWVGFNDVRDSSGFTHNCGADYDFDHYRLRGDYGLYEYRGLGASDQMDRRTGRPLYNPRKNPVVGFQLEGVGWTDSPNDPEAKLVSRLVEYATGVRAPFRLEKFHQLWKRRNLERFEETRGTGVQDWYVPSVTLPIGDGRYGLTVAFGEPRLDYKGEWSSFERQPTILVGWTEWPPC